MKILDSRILPSSGHRLKQDFEKIIWHAGRWEIKMLSNVNLVDFDSIMEWLAFQNHIIKDLTICSISVDETIRICWPLDGLPQTDLYSNFIQMLEVNEVDTSICKSDSRPGIPGQSAQDLGQSWDNPLHPAHPWTVSPCLLSC
jgi:hypothetical protein